MEKEIKQVVKTAYAKIALQSASGCCSSSSCSGSAGSCCSGVSAADANSLGIGYTHEDIKSVPQGSNLGLGCGNPIALASLREGETVLDLGSGAGFDCFLAAARVGAQGRVIGVDMTPEMIDKARQNAAQGNYQNVEFRLGEIESLPVTAGSMDVVISNCVINLCPDKQKVFSEIFRVLKPGGRMLVSDMVISQELPDILKNSSQAYVGCIAGAALKKDYLDMICQAGFQKVKVVDETTFTVEYSVDLPENKASPGVAGPSGSSDITSLRVSALKPS